MSDDVLARGRGAAAQRRWRDAWDLLQDADGVSLLGAEDLELLALTSAMLGKIDAASDAWARAHRALIGTDPARAARCAFWLGITLINNGDMARGGAWVGRTAKALEGEQECAERGLLLVAMGLRSLHSGDAEGAHRVMADALAIGERFRDAELLTLAGVGSGQALIDLGRIEEGLDALDQAMVTVTTDAVFPLVAGIAYCAVILACRDSFDLRRAREWTKALDAWSGSQPGLVPFRGQCLVHRSEILQMQGSWSDAIDEAQQARARLEGQPAIGMAFYQLAELHRVQGSFEAAAQAYRDAHSSGHPAHPGLALLQLAQGNVSVSIAAITTALEETREPGRRCRLLSAAVEIALAAGQLDRARSASNELDRVAAGIPALLLRAICAFARGAVQLEDGDAREALITLRAALELWQELDVPYEVARTRALIARACGSLGDPGTAELERDAARRAFEGLGAVPALAVLEDRARPGGLTPREAEILRLVATGKTNRAIAAELVISQKTVARHLSNIFTKLDLSTRAEATAYAFKHGIA